MFSSCSARLSSATSSTPISFFQSCAFSLFRVSICAANPFSFSSHSSALSSHFSISSLSFWISCACSFIFCSFSSKTAGSKLSEEYPRSFNLSSSSRLRRCCFNFSFLISSRRIELSSKDCCSSASNSNLFFCRYFSISCVSLCFSSSICIFSSISFSCCLMFASRLLNCSSCFFKLFSFSFTASSRTRFLSSIFLYSASRSANIFSIFSNKGSVFRFNNSLILLCAEIRHILLP